MEKGSLRKYLFNVFGFLCVLLGLIGALLPLLPTTPFLILAAYFFSKGSPRFRHWLINNKYFGPSIIDWQTKGAIRKPYKILATGMLLISGVIMLSRPQIPTPAKVSFVILATGLLTFVWTRPSE